LYHEKKTEEMSKKIKTTNKETISPGNTHFWYPTTSCPNNKREKRNPNWCYIKTYIKLSFDFDYTCAPCAYVQQQNLLSFPLIVIT
jgi:hypothetical protein